MDREPEVIRRQMAVTRASLADNLECLEQQVVDTAQEARAAVTETVATVQQAVEESVASVRSALDVRRHAERHPWAMFGSSLALGYFAGRLLLAVERGTCSRPERSYRAERPADPSAADMPPRRNGGADGGPSRSRFQPEIDRLKGLALGAVMGLARDLVADALPPTVDASVRDVLNQITVKLGGEPIPGPILQTPIEGAVRTAHAERPAFAEPAPDFHN